MKAKIAGDQAEVDVVVAWQASWFEPPAAKSKRTSMDATQRWVLRKSNKNSFGLEVISYNAMAEPFKYAPGFASALHERSSSVCAPFRSRSSRR